MCYKYAKKMNKDDYYCFEKGGENKKHKILLVYPNLGSEARDMSLYPPLSLLYPASYLKDYSVAIFDQRVDPPERFEELLEQNPLCVGISIMTGIQIKYALELAEKAKQKGALTVFGGVHPTILPEQTLEDLRVDYVIKGDGEVAFRNLVESLKKGENPSSIIGNMEVDLKNFPSLPYELVDVENYVNTVIIEGRALPVLFSKGCPFECTFCCNPLITGRKYKTMDIDKAIEQIMDLVDTYNLSSIIFWDENLAANPDIFNKLVSKINGKFKWHMQTRANALLNYDLKFLERMGAYIFAIGLESGSNEMLKKIKKQETVEEYIEANRRLAKTNILTWYNYIVGYPDETLEDLKATVNLALKMLDENPNANHNTFAMLVPYPGTEIARTYVQADLLPKKLEDWSDFGRHNFNIGWHPPERIKLYKRICFSSKFTGRKLRRHFPKDEDLKEFSELMTEKWRNFDFYNDKEWEKLTKSGWQILKKLFGDKAY